MSEFKIDRGVPLIIPAREEHAHKSEAREEIFPSGKKRGRKPRCKTNLDHVWEDLGNSRERCIKCGNRIPCSEADPCYHIECIEATGRPLPDWCVEINSTKPVDSDPEKI